MDSKEKRDESNNKSANHNVMKVFGSFVVADRQWNKTGLRDEMGAESKTDQNMPQIVSLTPSEYMSQLLMTTEERMELLTKVNPVGTKDSHDYCDFEPVPNIVVFQQYRPGNVYNVTLTIRNMTKVSHFLKLGCEIDPAFKVEYKGTSSLNTRLAAGMHSAYNVQFAPEENRDYEYEIKFISDRGVFVVPVIAIGARPILDFPDLIVLPETAVKTPSVKSLLVRNLGDKDAAFIVSSTSPNFWLEPSKGVIEEEETVQFAVNFLSSKTGFFEGTLFLTYETGEVVRIEVQGSAVECNVRLERGSVRMQEETYLGLSTTKTLKIFNRSEYIVKYQWMRYKDNDSDLAKKEEYKQIYELINKAEMTRCVDLVHYNICTPEVHELICQRIYADEIAWLMNEKFVYKNSHFSLVPMDGEIWPQNFVEVTVYFEPDEIGELSSTAYLELTGREDRIPLSLSGLSVGPLMKLNVATIDVQNIFLCSIHNFQVVCANRGLIPGVLVYRPKPSDFGGNITVTPNHVKLQPGQYSSFNVSFSSNRNGDFVERVEFIVKESLEVVAMYIKGCVVCPTLHFDKRRLDFGTTALGFTSKQEVVLHNDSLVPVTFTICVPDDGLQAVITHEDFVKAARKPSFPSSPQEFQVDPHEGVVATQSSLKVKISFTPNAARVGNRILRVDMWDTDSVPVSLPISFRSKTASLVVKPAEFDIRFCFLNYPYARTLTVENNSEVEGCFYIVPQSASDSTSIQYSMSTYQGYLSPGQSKSVSMTIITRAMGKHKCVISMLTFGEKGPTACCLLTCNGQGPVVSVQPVALDWGDVELLEDKTMLLTLISDSPVPTEFIASLSSKNSPWSVFPTSGDLNPGQSVQLQVTVLLRNVGKHVDKIVVTIPRSREILVSLSAIGIGSCIVCDPPVFPTFNMGLLLSNQDIRLPIVVMNQGSRNLKLVFATSTEVKLLHGGQVQTPTYDKFSIEPLVIELPAESTKKVFCNARSDTCGTFSEQWWLHCFFEGHGKREIMGNGTFVATFVEPSMSFSKRELSFRIDMGKVVDKSQQTDELFVTNESGLSLHCLLSIDEPFGLITEDGSQVQRLRITLKKHAKLNIRAIFSPKADKTNRRSKTYNCTLRLEYEEHPNADKIKCLGNVNFPSVAPLPEEIRFDCPLGCSVAKNIFINNRGPLDASYKFVWIEESISIIHDSSSPLIEEKCNPKTSTVKDQSDNSELLAETKDLLLGILKSFSKEETGLSESKGFDNGPKVTEEINQICSIVPYEGIVPAHSSQCISLGFHGVETLTLEAKLLCEIDEGPSELIKVFAAADDVQFTLEKERIDFGQQMIWELSRETIKLENRSRIQLIYHVELAGKVNESLEIRPMSAAIPAQSTTELEITSQPLIPGAYRDCFKLCIDHALPISILVEGFAIVSQVYVSLPRDNMFQNYSVELGYLAAQMLPYTLDSDDTLEEDEKGWQVVIHDDSLPSVTDIEMAVESLIAKQFIEETYSSMLVRSTISKHEGPIPYLFAPEYVLDMGYVIVGQSAQASIRVYNCGTRGTQIRLNKSNTLEKLAKLGIIIHFRDQSCLIPGEYANVEVSFTPKRLKASEKSSDVRRKFYLEVTNGFTLVIMIVATVTYPALNIDPITLNFSEVLISECMLMHLFIKNDGLIDCQWEAKLPPTRRNQADGPFSLQNTRNVFSPGQSGSIKIYFKPQKSGYVESTLTVEICHGLKPVTVDLRGRGIEHKLRIVQPWIHFSPILPYNSSVGQNFTIENVGQRAIEVYWQHLEQPDLQENRLIRVLTHYYRVEEILLPLRRPPNSSSLPSQLFDFYNSLVDEMVLSTTTQQKIDAKQADDSVSAIINSFEEESRSKRRGSSTRKMSKKLTRTESIATALSEANLSILSESDALGGKGSCLPADDADEIEKLLHCYIDDLQKQPDFFEKMKDPIKEVFDSLENEELKLDISSLPKKKNTCVIFHGESSTEYEEAACRAARYLELPLWNLNNTITETIALGNTACSAKIREIIDSKYRELLTASEKSLSEETQKIFTIEELSAFDSLIRYEYKIEAIQNSGNGKTFSVSGSSTRGGKGSAKGDKSPKTPRGKVEETFLDIDRQLLTELLEQRLAMPDLSEGFVLQTLKNSFIKSEEKTLSTLLQILGDIEYPIFVTFHKPLASHKSARPESHGDTHEELIDETSLKLMQIDEMSSSEFDLLSDADKELYRDRVLLARSQEALRRRMEFQRRISELRKQKDQSQRKTSRDSKRKNVGKRGSKIVPQSSRVGDRLATLESPNKKKSAKVDSVKSTARKTVPEEIAAIDANRTEADASNLETIMSILGTWDPTGKSIDPNHKETGRSKTQKNPKRGRLSTAPSKPAETNNRFWIWHVKTSPRDSMSGEDIIANEMKRNKSVLNPKLEISAFEIEPELRSQMYSVVQPKKSTRPVSAIASRGEQAEVFDLVALRCGSNLSSEIPSKDEQALSEILEEPLEPRLVLQPHESRLFRAYFHPKRVGLFQQEFPLVILNSYGSSHAIEVNGSGDLPRVNMEPSLIFRKIKEVKRDEMNDPTYFTDTNTFDFGSLLLPDKDDKAHRKKTSFKFWNPSKMDLELKISLLADNWKSYDIEPKELMIKPNECGVIAVTAAAEKLGPNEDQLVLLMTGNPRVEFVHMRSNGAKLDVELEGKQISFGKVLKHREVTKTLRVRNSSPVPIYWRINAVDSVDPQVKFSPPNGSTKARSETTILFTYLANSIGILDKTVMAFNVFLNEGDGGEDAIFKDTITVTGETYDVAVDVLSANPIALGTVIVGSTASTIFTITNRGLYDVNYVIEFEKNVNFAKEIGRDLRKNLREDLQVSPSTGTVGANKISTVNVNFQPKFEMHLKEIPLLRCNLIDPNNIAAVVAELPLTVSIASHYVRFRLIPDSEISFGPVSVCANKTLHLSIENIGFFPLKYHLKNAVHPLTSAEDSKKQKKDKSARTDTNKHGTAKSRDVVTTLRVGPFTFPKSEGIVTPNGMETLKIDCYPEAVGHVEENILVLVDDCLPDDRPGRSIKLNVDSSLPSIDFSDLETIFQDGYLVDDIRDFVCPKGIDAHTVFARHERCLYFRSVIIHKTHTTTIKLCNRGTVPARVTVSLRPDVLTPKNAKPEAFALDTVEETVLPMSSHLFAVSFTPSLIETYSGVLEATVESPAHLRSDTDAKLSIKLSGEGNVPEVILVEPPMTSAMRAASPRISFGRCLVRETASQNLAFKNIGSVTAKVIVEINHDNSMIYTIGTHNNVPSSTGIWIDADDASYEEKKRSVVCSLRPDEAAHFFIEFHPHEVGPTEAQIRLHVLDNPYQDITIDLVGEGFMENVVLVGLPIVEASKSNNSDGQIRSRKSTKNRSGALPSVIGSSRSFVLQTAAFAPTLIYNLDYDTCFVNKMHKIIFKIVNKSGERCFRFQLGAHPNVVFVPSVGHLQRCESKDVTATFLTTEPVAFRQVCLECEVYEIFYSGKRSDGNLWDDRQTSVERVSVGSEGSKAMTYEEKTTKEAIVPSMEPSHEVVAGTGRTIRLMFSAVAAFSEYSCLVEEINFKDTLMFQSREYSFFVENSGNVDVLFDWKIEMDVECSKRLADGALRAAAFRSRSFGNNDSRPSSRSSGGILYPEAEKRSLRYIYSRNQRGDEENLADLNLVNDGRSFSSRDNLSLVDVEPCASPCATRSDLFSDSAARTQRSTDSWIEDGDDQPFSVKPTCGKIPAGQSLQFALRFSPLDVFDYKANLTCQMENLHPNLEPLTIAVTGRSLLPYCHFEIEESDYLTRRLQSQRNYPDDGSGDSNESAVPRVVEFRVVGTGESHEKEFYLINPTTDDYRFTWKDITSRGPEELPYFHCVREEDLAESGKRSSVKFTFFAEKTGVFESVWRFSIDRYSLDAVFLLVAVVAEPAVHCLDPRLRLKPSILGSKVEDTVVIVNDEDFKLPFKILPHSLRSEEDGLQALVVAPLAGILQPKSQQILQVSFLPSNAGEFSFLVQCQVKTMSSPLSIVVTAKVGKIIPRVLYSCGPKGQQMLQAHYDRETVLDFGKLTLNEPSAIKFEIANIGDVVFHYKWDLGVEDPDGAYSLTINRETELVLSESVSACYLELTIAQKTTIRRHPVTLKISNGPVYHMYVKTSTKQPSIEFSFVDYDFGPCYIRDVNAPAYIAQLSVTNNDKTPAIVECNYPENLPHMNIDLEVLSQAIAGHSTVTLPISFRPLQQLRYTESLNFLINDSSIQQTIVIKGEGIAYKICLVNPRDKYVELGQVPVEKTVTRKVRVLNTGRAPVKISFDIMKALPGYEKNRRLLTACQDESEAQSKHKSQDSRQLCKAISDLEENVTTLRDILNVQPRNIVSLPANKSIEVIVKFTPTRRVNSFVEKIGAQVDSTILPLFYLRGSCVAREFRLNRPHLYFGTVVEGCTSETKLVLQNTGDFGARFKWNIPKFKPHFHLHPTSGYCSPGMDVTFTVTFHPVQLAPLLEAEAVIDLEKHASLRLSCSGACRRMPDPIESLKFSVPVRTAQTRDFTITNDTSVAWNVKTVLSGDFFYTDEHFSVPAKKSHSCSVTYAPLVMNSDRKLHQGKLLVELPDDKQPLVYSLLGASLPPVVEAKIERQLPAKTKYTELLPVHNWLNKPQSFRCDIKLVDDLKATPVLYSFTGNTKLDVPASGARDFRASFYCYKEATLNFRITFTNGDGEYEFYEVRYKVSKPDVLSTVKLVTSARSSVCYLLPIENPLEDRSLSFTANCQHRDITIKGVPIVVPAKKSDNLAIEYSPLLPGEGVARLEVTCADLGNFPYELKLKATAAPPEKINHVTATLGSSTTFPIVIGNSSGRSAEFLIKVDDPSFTCDRSVVVPPHKENIVEITYEPCDAKNVTATLTAVSEILGEFIFPLIGSYTLPKPQGPFTISANSSISIVFKNVFTSTKTFEYILDGPADFTLATHSGVVESKKVATIIVRFNSSGEEMEQSLGEEYPVTGKLVVSCTDPAFSHVVWVYYLRGIRE